MNDTIVWFQKYTTLIGGPAGATYLSDPFEVTAQNQINSEVFVVAATAAGSTAQVFGSSDMLTWTPIGAATPLVAGPPPAAIATVNPPRYVQLQVVVPIGVTLTLWAKGVARMT